MKALVSEQEQLQKQAVTRILRWAYGLLPFAYGIIILTRVITGHWETVSFVLVASAITLMAYLFLRKDKLETSIIIFIFSLILVVTMLCTLNNGIHDIGIVAYPVVLLLASLMLRFWQQAVAFLLILASIFWLALGEAWGYYSPVPVGQSSVAELIIIFVVIASGGLICYRIAKQLKKMVARTDKKVLRRLATTEKLKRSLDQKIKLTSAVHAQVAHSIAIIRDLLNHQPDQPLKSLPEQLLTIEIIHAELHRLGVERVLELDGYLNALFVRQPDAYAGLSKQIFPDLYLNVDQSMSLGLILNELAQQQPLTGTLEAKEYKEQILLTLTAIKPLLTLTPLADIMVRQLAAKMTLDGNVLSLRFDLKTQGHGL